MNMRAPVKPQKPKGGEGAHYIEMRRRIMLLAGDGLAASKRVDKQEALQTIMRLCTNDCAGVDDA